MPRDAARALWLGLPGSYSSRVVVDCRKRGGRVDVPLLPARPGPLPASSGAIPHGLHPTTPWAGRLPDQREIVHLSVKGLLLCSPENSLGKRSGPAVGDPGLGGGVCTS